jgi:mannose-6-phosphate isomerase-like protein (cupin superfamily)
MSEYTVMRAAEAPDFTGDHPGAFLGYGRPMGAEQIAFNVRVLEPGMTHMPPGGDPTAGHSHVTIEEIYFVLEGEITLKLGDDVITLGPRDAVLIPASTPRAVRNEGEAAAAFALVSAKVEDIRAETVPHEGLWPTG